MRTISFCLLFLALASTAQAADAGLAHSDNFIVLASNEALADQVLASAEHYRRQAALEWLGFELPQGAGRTAVTAKISPVKNGGLTWPKRDNSGKLHHVWVTFSDPNSVEAMLHHEIVHVVFNTYCDEGLPAWIEEGAASMVDDPERTAIRRRIIQGFAQTGNWPNIERTLLAQGIDSTDQSAYSVAASVTAFLLTRGDKLSFVRFGAMGQRVGWDQALREVYGIASVRALATQWQTWAARR